MPKLSFIVFALSILLTSCQNDAEIGDLYGQWQITSVHTSDGDFTPDDVYLAFQNDVVFARLTGTDAHYADHFIAAFRHYGDSLSMSFHIEGESADVIHTYLNERFHFTGDHSNLRFGIEQLNANHLVLTNGSSRWSLRSY